MEHLSRETIEKFVRGEFPYPQLLEISAHLLGCSNQCQPILDRIDPKFMAKVNNLETARINFAEQETHFSENEIEGYVSKSFGIEKRRQMNRHFTKCRICSQNLKNQDPDFLTNFIKDNLKQVKEPEALVQGKESEPFFRILIPAAVFSLLIILSLAIIFMLPNNQTSDQAKLVEVSPSPFAANINTNSDENKHIKNTDYNNVNSEAPVNSSPQPKDQTNGSKSEPPVKTVVLPSTQKQSNQTKNNKSQDIIVKNRSLDKNCESNPNLAITPKDEVITDIQPNLSWKPYPNAVSYKIYLSDTENNLVEISDIAKGEITSYKVTNKLESNKKYEWKVVATLKDGKEVYSETANFSVGEKAKKSIKIKRSSFVNATRCSKN